MLFLDISLIDLRKFELSTFHYAQEIEIHLPLLY